MNPVWVVGAAVVSALGDDPDELWSGLLAGRSGIRPLERFPTAGYKTHVAACVPGLGSPAPASLVTVLIDRLCARLPPLSGDTLLIASTTKGGVDCLELLARRLPTTPDDIPLPALGAALRRRLGLTAPGFTISAACASGSIALGRGAELVASGAAAAVLVVAFDALTEFVFSGFSALQALSPGACAPFDRARSGLTLGEGAAALLLSSPARARDEGREPIGELLGWGASNDAVHITAPARDSRGLIQAIRAALARAGLEPEDVGGVSAHGTGTLYNDLMELNAFRAVFGERPVPVYGVKGALGHTLGAAGAIEAIVGLRALAEGVAPGTVGFRDPDPAAGGLVHAEATPLLGRSLLLTNSGFGGVNGALVLGGKPRGPRASAAPSPAKRLHPEAEPDIFVSGVGWVGAAGMGTGRGPAPFSLPPGDLPSISRQDVFSEPDSRFGRLDPFSRLALTALTLALRDAGLEAWSEPRAAAVAASTTYGCMGTDLEYLATLGAAPGLASPQLFAYTLPNVFLGEAAIRFGLTGPTVIVSDEGGTGSAALATALDYLAGGGDVALAGICDLARPALLPGRPDPTPGALFVVLERRPTREPLGVVSPREARTGSPDTTHGLRELAARLCAARRALPPSPTRKGSS